MGQSGICCCLHHLCLRESLSLPAGLLLPLPVPKRSWSRIALDFVSGLPISNGNSVILTIIHRFSKAVLPLALETTQLLLQHVFHLHGIPLDIDSERGPQFISYLWKVFCSALGASVSLSSGFHPQTNGQTERANQNVGTALFCLVSSNPSTQSEFLPWIEYAHNSPTSSATGMSPFMCALGYQPPLFPEREQEVAVPSVQHHLRQSRRI